jgi:hypothetical protein
MYSMCSEPSEELDLGQGGVAPNKLYAGAVIMRRGLGDDAEQHAVAVIFEIARATVPPTVPAPKPPRWLVVAKAGLLDPCSRRRPSDIVAIVKQQGVMTESSVVAVAHRNLGRIS